MRLWVFVVLCLMLLGACSEKKAPAVKKSSPSLPEEIRIYTDGIGWDAKAPCVLKYKGETIAGGVKFRGGMSSRYDKHSMTIELESEVSLVGLPTNDDWILNASYIDKTFQRHKLSYDLFRAMHPDNMAPKCAYIPVYVNDNYQGLYVLMEKVNGSWLGLNNDSDGLFKDPFIFVEERLDNVQDPGNYFQQKYPKSLRNQDYWTIQLEKLKRNLFELNDPDELAKILGSHWFDLRNIMDWQLLLMVTNNDDGLYKNFYMYCTIDSEFQMIPWDYDHSFGRDGDYQLNLIEYELGWDRMILFQQLMAAKEFGYPQALKKRWEELRQTVFTEKSLLELIALNEKGIRPHLEKNAKRWPLDAKWYSDANSYDEEIEIIKKFVPMRLKQLDDFFNTLQYGKEEEK